MRIGIGTETMPGERRVALVPDSVARLVKAGHQVWMERGAGHAAAHPDQAYSAAGATVADADTVYRESQLVARVRRPVSEEVRRMRSGTVIVSLLQPAGSRDLLQEMAEHRITAFSLELVPRITRAQGMDVLSSQSTVAGYKAVLEGAAELPRMLPMLTTAAGTIAPARAFIIGAGVAGLQAIATARRLGAVVSAFDIRPAAKEQVESLGAKFVAAEAVSAEAEDRGGYARAQTEDQQQQTLNALAAHITSQDLVITTAQIPGRPAPRLITEEMVRSMKPGSVIVDLAAEAGGNCALTRPGERVEAGGVVILGPINLPASVPLHASQMFSRNIENFINHLSKQGELHIDLADEITGAMCVTHNGEVRLEKKAA